MTIDFQLKWENNVKKVNIIIDFKIEKNSEKDY